MERIKEDCSRGVLCVSTFSTRVSTVFGDSKKTLQAFLWNLQKPQIRDNINEIEHTTDYQHYKRSYKKFEKEEKVPRTSP